MVCKTWVCPQDLTDFPKSSFLREKREEPRFVSLAMTCIPRWTSSGVLSKLFWNVKRNGKACERTHSSSSSRETTHSASHLLDFWSQNWEWWKGMFQSGKNRFRNEGICAHTFSGNFIIVIIIIMIDDDVYSDCKIKMQYFACDLVLVFQSKEQ